MVVTFEGRRTGRMKLDLDLQTKILQRLEDAGPNRKPDP